MRVVLNAKAWLLGRRDHARAVSGPVNEKVVTPEQLLAVAGGPLNATELAVDATVTDGQSGLPPEDPASAGLPTAVPAASELDRAPETGKPDPIAVPPAATVVEFLKARLADAESALAHSLIHPPIHAASGGSDLGSSDVAATRSLIAGCCSISDPETGWESEPRRLARRILGHLAAFYSDHPDFREEWRPTPDVPHNTPGTISLDLPLRLVDADDAGPDPSSGPAGRQLRLSG